MLHPSRGRRLALFLFSLAMIAGSTVFAVAAPNVPVAIVAGGFAALFVFSAIELAPGTGSLRIAADGLTVKTTLRRRHWAWNDVEHFHGYEIHHQYGSTKLVGFDRRDMTPQRQGAWRTISRGMSGVDESLPETYGAAAMGLAVVLQPNTVTVGVSGIIFGIAGCALVRDLHRTRPLGAVAWSIVPVGLIYTFLVPHLSVGAHVGGLAAGLLLGLVMERAGGMDDAWLTTSRRSPSA